MIKHNFIAEMTCRKNGGGEPGNVCVHELWVPVMLQALSRATQERIGRTLESVIIRGKAEMALMSAVFLHRILGDSCPKQILIT